MPQPILHTIGTFWTRFRERFETSETRMDEHEILGAVCEQLETFMKIPYLAVVMRDRLSGRLKIVLSHQDGKQGVVQDTDQEKVFTQIGREKIKDIIRTGNSTLLVTQKAVEECCDEPEDYIPQATWLGVPMRLKGIVVGAFVALHPKKEQFYDEDDRIVLDMMSDQAAVAIDYARLTRNFELLAAVERELTSFRTDDERKVLEFLYQKVQAFKEIYTQNLSIILEDKVSGSLQVVLAEGELKDPENSEEQKRLFQNIQLKKEEITVIIREQKPTLLQYRKQVQAKSFIHDENLVHASLLGVPMRLKDKAIGAFITYHPTQEYLYDQNDVSILDALSDQAANAIDNARLLQRFKLLSEIEKELTSGVRLNKENVLRLIGDQTRRFQEIDTRNLSIILHDADQDRLDCFIAFQGGHLIDNIQTEDVQQNLLKQLGEEAIRKIIRDKKALLFRNKDAIQAHADLLGSISYASWVGVPMRFEDVVIGAFVTYHEELEYVYDEEARDILDAISDQAAVALENVRLTGRLIKAERDIASEITSEEEVLLQRIHATTQQFEEIDTRNLSIILYDDVEKRLQLVLAVSNGKALNLAKLNIQEWLEFLGKERIEAIIETGSPIVLKDREAVKANSPSPGEAMYASWLGVPMRSKDGVIGAFVTYHASQENVYDEDDQEILDSLSDQAANAITTARILKSEQEQRRQAEVLQELAKTVNSTLDRKAVCEAVLSELRTVIYYETASIQRIYGDQRTLIAYYGLPTDKYDPELLRNVSEDALISEIVREKHPIVISDTTRTDREWEQLPSTAHVKSWIGVPLIAQAEVIGVLTIDHTEPGYYIEGSQEIVMMFANHAATALINAELFEQRENYLNILEEVYPSLPEIGKKGFSTVLQRILENGVALTSADYAELWLYNSDTQEIQVEVDYKNQRGKVMYQKGQLRFHVYERQGERESIIGHVIRTGQAYLCHDVSQNPYYWAVESDVRSELAVPLRHQNDIIGVLNFESKKLHAFTPEQQRVLEALASPATIAIQNAHLYEQLEDWNTRQKILINIGQQFTLGTHRNQNKILELIYEQATKLPGMRDNFSIALYEEGTDTVSFELAVVNGVRIQNVKEVDGWKPRQAVEGKTEEIIQNKAPLLLPTQEAVEERGFSPIPNKDYVGGEARFANSWLGVPMRIGSEKVIGVLATYHYGQDYYYQEKDIEILQSLADHAAIALENARLSEQVKALTTIGQDLTSKIDIGEEDVLELIYEEAVQKLHMENFSIALYEPPGAVRFVLASRQGEKVPDLASEPRWQPRKNGKGKTERIITEKQALVLNSHEEVLASEKKRGSRHKDWGEHVSDAWLGVPMMVGDRILGVLADYRYGKSVKYTKEEVEIFQSLANIAAIALENARLYKIVQESEQKFADIIEFLPDATLVIDQEGKVIAWNKAIEDMTGVKAKDIINKGEYAYSIPFYGRKRRILIDLALKTDEAFEQQHYTNVRRTTEDTLFAESYIPDLLGKEVHFFAAASILRDAEGNIIGAIESIRDITALKQTQNNLQEAHDQLEEKVKARTAELEALNDRQKVLIELGHQLTSGIQRTEQEILEIIHLQASRLMDTDNMYIALYDEQDDTIHFPLFYKYGKAGHVDSRKLVREKRGRTEEIIVTRKPILILTREQSVKWYAQPEHAEFIDDPLASWIGVPIMFSDKILGVIATYHPQKDYVYDQEDLEILKSMANSAAIALENGRLYKHLAEANSTIAEKQAILTKTMIASDFVHRMNNLAGTIPVWVQLIQEELTILSPKPSEGVSIYLQNIADDAKGLMVEAERLKDGPQRTEINLSEMLLNLLEHIEVQYANEIRAKRVRIKEEIPAQLYKIRGERQSLANAIFNIISNGIEAILQKPEGTLSIHAKNIEQDGAPEEVRIDVEDTGIGIKQERLERIFDASFTTKGTGHGYGLFSTKTVIENHHGRITHTSKENFGTTFTIWLPKA